MKCVNKYHAYIYSTTVFCGGGCTLQAGWSDGSASDNHSHDYQGDTTPVCNSWLAGTDCVRQWPSTCLCWLCWICSSEWQLAYLNISILPSIKWGSRKDFPHLQRSDEGRKRRWTHPTTLVGTLSADLPHNPTFNDRNSTLRITDGLESSYMVGPSETWPWAKS